MPAVQRYSLEELLRRLKPYKCRKFSDIIPGVELWVTGWNEPFTLSPEPGGYYDEFQLRRVIRIVGETMPPNWNGNGNGNGKP